MRSRLFSVALAILHRALASGMSFTLTVVAGRALDAESFGSFAVALGVYSFFMVPHSSFMSEPALIYGSKDYSGSTRRYALLLYTVHIIASVIAAVGLLVAGLWFIGQGQQVLGHCFVALAFVLPILLLTEFDERLMIMLLRPDKAIVGALITFVALGIILTALTMSGFFSAPIAILAFAGAATTGNIYFIYSVLRVPADMNAPPLVPREVLMRHLRYGAWSVVGQFLIFALINAYIFLLPLIHGLAETAAFRAQAAVTGPIAQAYAALGVILMPMLRQATTKSEFRRTLLMFCAATVSIGIGAALTIGIGGDWLLGLLYGNKYHLSSWGYWLAGLYPGLIGQCFVLGAAVRAIDKPEAIAWQSAVAAVIALPLGLWTSVQFGVEGAIGGQVIGALILATLIILFGLRGATNHLPD